MLSKTAPKKSKRKRIRPLQKLHSFAEWREKNKNYDLFYYFGPASRVEPKLLETEVVTTRSWVPSKLSQPARDSLGSTLTIFKPSQEALEEIQRVIVRGDKTTSSVFRDCFLCGDVDKFCLYPAVTGGDSLRQRGSSSAG
jgi:hypothetical protein